MNILLHESLHCVIGELFIILIIKPNTIKSLKICIIISFKILKQAYCLTNPGNFKLKKLKFAIYISSRDCLDKS